MKLARGNTETRFMISLEPPAAQVHTSRFKGYHTMKRFLLAILAFATISGASAQTVFPDVPAGHWAEDAVARIADLGIVIGFPDGTFRGNESFTRYQAALVVSRLLDVIAADIDAARALTDQDLAALRNALQELASDVAAQDARLTAVEDSIGAIADQQARIEALEQALAGLQDGEALRDLQNQLAALRTQVDTAQATAENAEALANQALDGLAALEAQVADHAAAIRALNELVAILNDELVNLTPGEPVDLSEVQGDIANIREFVILLRRDQVALRDRVAALEGRVDEQGARIDDLDARLTAVEENPLGLTGSLTFEYYVGRGTGAPFDIDRAYGLEQLRPVSESIFSAPTRENQRRVDIVDMPRQIGAVSVNLNASFAFGRGFTFTGPRGLQEIEGTVDLGLRRAVGLTDPDGNTFDGYVFTLNRVNVFTGIGGADIQFQFGQDISAEFTPYVFTARPFNRDVRTGGFVATIGGAEFLPFLSPTLTVVYGTPGGLNTGGDDADDVWVSLRAARLTLSPFEGFTIGGSFAQLAVEPLGQFPGPGDTVQTGPIHAADPLGQATVFGVDAQASISIFNLQAEFAQQSVTGGTLPPGVTAGDATLIYAIVDVDAGEILPVITDLEANYRSIPGNWWGLRHEGPEADRDFSPFRADQQGFGVAAGLELFIVDVEVYFDTYATTAAPDAAVPTPPAFGVSNTAFGVGVGVELFAGFELAGFFKGASVNGAAADRTVNRGDNLAFDNWDFSTGRNFSNAARGGLSGAGYVSGFGVQLAHEGDAENALIDNLTLRLQYQQLGADLDISVIDALAEYELVLSGLTISPAVRYTTFNEGDANTADNDNTTTLRAGLAVSTEPFEFFLRPSLAANVNYRSTSHTNEVAAGAAGAYTATELQFSVELALNEFIFDETTLRARYGTWIGTNVANIARTDENLLGDVTTVSGYELFLDYYGLEMSYGVYTLDDVAASQAFRVRYTVTF
jgi:peptidoglycan hydrolase CwlO-like protein